MAYIVLLGIAVAAVALAAIWVRQDGGPSLPHAAWDGNEWSPELPSHPYASRFNQQFSSAWDRGAAHRDRG